MYWGFSFSGCFVFQVNEKNSSTSLDQFFQSLNMFMESFPAKRSDAVSGVRPPGNELLFDTDVIFSLQRFDVRGQVAVGSAQKFFQRIEISVFIDHQNRHHTQTDPVVEGLVDIFEDVFQNIIFYRI